MNFNILKSENKFFDNPIGTSGLSKPEFDSFINYSRHLYSYNNDEVHDKITYRQKINRDYNIWKSLIIRSY